MLKGFSVKIVFIILFLNLLSINANANADEKIRVRITTLPLNLNVQGLGVVFEADKNTYKKVGIPQMQIFKVNFKNETWEIDSDHFSKRVKSPFLALEGDYMQINSSLVPSKIFLWPRGKEVDVIAVLPMEEYLEGVLPHEMPVAWPLEALKAQSIVARSFTLTQVKARKEAPYHLDSTVNDQVYKYVKSFSQADLAKIKEAIQSTHDQILVDAFGKPVRTLYHADCGGKTEKSSNVWGGTGVEFTVDDPFCPHGEYKNWSYELSKKELSKKLRIPFLAETVRKDSVTTSGRIQRISVISSFSNMLGNKLSHKQSDRLSSNMKSLNLSSQEFRQKIGYSKIRSTRFEIQDMGDRLRFVGRGFGHGVGLCQWGAKSWAQSGKDYKGILKHYFPSYILQTL